jgi:hypothetical protein
MGPKMTDPLTRIIRRNGKWHILARKVAHGAAQAAWIDLGGYACPAVALRLWLVCQGQDKR